MSENTNTTAVAANQERLANLKNDKKFINRIFWWLIFHITQLFTMERMLGNSMSMMMASAREDLYPGDPEKQRDLIERHAVFFNTQQGLGAIIYGICLGMEIEKARTGEVPNDIIQTIKTSLASPIAGIGDTFYQILFVPILLSIGIGMSANGSPIGAIFVLVVYALVNLPVTYILFKLGIKAGVDGAEMLISSPLKDRLMLAVETMGIIIVGGTVGSMVNVQTALEFNINGVVVNVQEQVFDAIYPGIFSVICFYITYWLIKEKRWSAMKIMLAMLVAAAIGYFTKILA